MLKWESKNASLNILFISSQFDLEPRKLICVINDVSGQDVVCRDKGAPDSRVIYQQSTNSLLMSSLSAFFSPCSPKGENMKISSGGGAGWKKSWECRHLHYWPSKSRVRLLTLRARSSQQHRHQLSTSWLKTASQTETDTDRHSRTQKSLKII